MTAIIFFLLSLLGMFGLVFLKSLELKTGTRNFISNLELWADRRIAKRFAHAKEFIITASIEVARGLALLIIDGFFAVRDMLMNVWENASDRFSILMREKKLVEGGTVSIFLKSILDHKETLRQDR